MRISRRLAHPWLWVALLAISGITVQAAELTREAVLQAALQNNTGLRVSAWEIEQVSGQRLAARGALLPRLSVSGSAEIRDSALIDRAPDGDGAAEAPVPERAETPISRDSYSAKLELVQSVFAGMERQYGYRAAQFRQEAKELSLLDRVIEVIFSANLLFDRVLAAQERVSSRIEGMARAAKVLRLAEGRHESGQVEEYQVLQARSQLMQARVDLERARVERVEAMTRLLEIMGLEQAAKGAAAGETVRLQGALPVPQLQEDELGEIAHWVEANPRLRGLMLERQAASLETSVERRRLWPRLDVYANLQTRSSYFDSSENLSGWASGVVVRWDLFDGFTASGRIRARYAAERQLAERENEVRNSLWLSLRRAAEDLSARQRAFEAESAANELSVRAAGQVLELYELGRLDLDRVLAAEEQVAEAEERRRTALLEWNQTVHQLDVLRLRHWGAAEKALAVGLTERRKTDE